MDLAQATLGKASEMSLDDDSLAQLYSAIEVTANILRISINLLYFKYLFCLFPGIRCYLW